MGESSLRRRALSLRLAAEGSFFPRNPSVRQSMSCQRWQGTGVAESGSGHTFDDLDGLRDSVGLGSLKNGQFPGPSPWKWLSMTIERGPAR